ncbi:hypothetical protein INH39_18090 [Massilia violaceinigra]|uniref:Uncharacterized protein n=1 Tax=Massilia violaceinigra TaxID=2045208 RepID=A0ABY3ZYA0_9BURK|nr:hypothetical protein [Massilia violaceinigra]UOD27441.1 hypothetical protein INH39_18090 [Massilia violaceinigra]
MRNSTSNGLLASTLRKHTNVDKHGALKALPRHAPIAAIKKWREEKPPVFLTGLSKQANLGTWTQ